MQNEQLLLAAARDLDEAALLTIFDRYAPKVYLHALRRTHDPALADDIVSKVFDQFLDELAQGHEPDHGLRTYFYRSAIGHVPGVKKGWKEKLLEKISSAKRRSYRELTRPNSADF